MPKGKGKQRAAILTKVIKRKSSEEVRMQNQIPHRENDGPDDANKDNRLEPNTTTVTCIKLGK